MTALATASSSHPGQGQPALQHMPGLTGLRGIAVVAVVAYHLGHLRGGFIGVDLFFVLSGFLITSLLLDRPPGSPGEMIRWWGRRIRRLTPAAAVVVLAVLAVFAPTPRISLDGLATLTWWQNWQLVIAGNTYWESATSPLLHAWSLSIEEQFYLFWPPLLAALVALLQRRRPATVRGAVALVAFGGAVASFIWAAMLSSSPGADLSRIYFGTDSRAGALLLGCAMAAVVHGRGPRVAGFRATAAAAISSVVLVVIALVGSPEHLWTYRGGLVVIAVAAAVVVRAASMPGRVTRALSWRPLQWLGVRSYAIYLWAWPTQVLVKREAPTWSPALVALVTVSASLVLSDLSLRLVEAPLRHASSWAAAVRPRRAAWVAGSALAVIALVFAAVSAEPSVGDRLAAEFERRPDPVPAECAPTTPAPEWDGLVDAYDPATVQEGADPDHDGCDGGLRVLVVGDSTGRGAANGLRRVAPRGLQIWDRTELGCGLVPESAECPDWRGLWRDAVARISPDVVLVYLGVSGNLVAGENPQFLSAAGSELRQQEIGDAIELLASGGAQVVWSLPAPPLPNGVFYCGGSMDDTPCDPTWVDAWNQDVLAVSLDRGARTVDILHWFEGRADTVDQDRPDGLHLSGPALDAHARWLVEEMELVAR